MKNLQDKISQIFKKIKKSRDSYSRLHIKPHRDWVYILIISNIIIVILMSYSTFLYFEIDSAKFVSYDLAKSDPEIKLNIELLNKIVQDLKNREKNINSLNNSKIPQDPSR